MRPLPPESLEELARDSLGRQGQELLAARRLWGFKQTREKGIHAFVLDREQEPYEVQWHPSKKEDDGVYLCECPAFGPCAHLAALLLAAARRGIGDFRIQEEPSAETGAGEDLFGREALPGETLFLLPALPVKYKTVALLAPRPSRETEDKKERGEDKGRIGFQALGGKSWHLESARVPLREDGTWGRPRLQEKPLPFPPGQFLEGLIQGLRGGTVLLPSGRPWTYEKASSLELGFEPLLEKAGEQALYLPWVVFIDQKEQSLEGDLFAGKGRLFLLSFSAGRILELPDPGDAVWFLRLFFSRRALRAEDIHFRTARGCPPQITLKTSTIPQDLPFLSPRMVLEIQERSGEIDLSPVFQYDSVMVPARDKSPQVVNRDSHPPRVLGLRDPQKEVQLLNRTEELLGEALSWRRGRYAGLLGDLGNPFRLNIPLTQVLASYGELLLEAGIQIRLKNRPLRQTGKIAFAARKKQKLMEISAQVAWEDRPLPLELDEWLSKAGLARTEEGYFFLSPQALEQLAFLQRHGLDSRGFLETSPHNWGLIDVVYADLLNKEGDEAKDLARNQEQFRSFLDFSPQELPPGPDNFNAVLRPYQSLGLAWLLHLREHQMNGCLADDMGLGKTVQTLAYLTQLANENRLGPCLLAGPVVTLANWEVELTRFAPGLSFFRYKGPADRRKLPPPKEGQLIIVSYQTLRNDIEKFLDREWDTIILDEAQYIKNAASQTFKAVHSLKSRHRVSLTGTPLENHLSELWAQMNFLEPGLLGSFSQFNKSYLRSLQGEEDPGTLESLQKMVSPFIFRRRKEEVLPDLPPKEEIVLRCEMNPAQAEAYTSVRDLYYQQITGMLDEQGLAGSRIKILALLTKLRLLAIDPPLAGEPFQGIPSSKILLLEKLMEEVLAEGHKILVFSQFLGTLDRGAQICRQKGWDFARLDGGTGNREEEIQRFTQKKGPPVFLLSLRAGGVGINLTAADYVFLLDPWWNPAVENQAIDRSHRWGQTNPVTAYRLITAGTIEEKVLQLQESKKKLIQGILGEEDITHFSEKDVLELLR